MRSILAVWTRSLDDVDSFGRVNTARAVRGALEASGALTSTQIKHILGRPTLAGLAAAIGTFVLALLRGRPLPLQCTIFAERRSARDALHKAEQSDIVYADGIRTLLWLRRLRRRRPEVEIVVDLDDLMSRRYEGLLVQQLPPSLGYLEKSLPRVCARLVSSPALARAMLSYEQVALRHAEHEVLGIADRVVLANKHEASLLSARAAELVPPPRATVLAIPPPMRPAAAGALAPEVATWRAVFIGSDALVQNQLTIDYLLDLWQRASIQIPLVLYGRQKRPLRTAPNAVWAGYVRDIAEVYAPGSILVCPAFLRGGIKTKVLEGFAHGVPVVGNAATFEGLDLPDYPLRLNHEVDLLDFLADPSRYAVAIARAIEASQRCLEREHGIEIFRRRWAAAVVPTLPAGPVMDPRTCSPRASATGPHRVARGEC